MTDDSTAEKAALAKVWPEAKQLLCHFHVAQSEWRWLWASKNKVPQSNRRQYMLLFQKVRISVPSHSLVSTYVNIFF